LERETYGSTSGLAASALIDATLVRLVLVPSTMELLGWWNCSGPRPVRPISEERIAMQCVTLGTTQAP
jgi:hypothetical protein